MRSLRLAKPKTNNDGPPPTKATRMQTGSSNPDLPFRTSFEELRRPENRQMLRQHLTGHFPESRDRVSSESSLQLEPWERQKLSRSKSNVTVSTTTLGPEPPSSSSSTSGVNANTAELKRLSTVRERENAAAIDIEQAIMLLQELKKTASPDQLVALHKALLPTRDSAASIASSLPIHDDPTSLLSIPRDRPRSHNPPGLATRGWPTGDILQKPGEDRKTLAKPKGIPRDSWGTLTAPPSVDSLAALDLADKARLDPRASSLSVDEYANLSTYSRGPLRVTNGAASPDLSLCNGAIDLTDLKTESLLDTIQKSLEDAGLREGSSQDYFSARGSLNAKPVSPISHMNKRASSVAQAPISQKVSPVVLPIARSGDSSQQPVAQAPEPCSSVLGQPLPNQSLSATEKISQERRPSATEQNSQERRPSAVSQLQERRPSAVEQPQERRPSAVEQNSQDRRPSATGSAAAGSSASNISPVTHSGPSSVPNSARVSKQSFTSARQNRLSAPEEERRQSDSYTPRFAQRLSHRAHHISQEYIVECVSNVSNSDNGGDPVFSGRAEPGACGDAAPIAGDAAAALNKLNGVAEPLTQPPATVGVAIHSDKDGTAAWPYRRSAVPYTTQTPAQPSTQAASQPVQQRPSQQPVKQSPIQPTQQAPIQPKPQPSIHPTQQEAPGPYSSRNSTQPPQQPLRTTTSNTNQVVHRSKTFVAQRSEPIDANSLSRPFVARDSLIRGISSDLEDDRLYSFQDVLRKPYDAATAANTNPPKRKPNPIVLGGAFTKSSPSLSFTSSPVDMSPKATNSPIEVKKYRKLQKQLPEALKRKKKGAKASAAEQETKPQPIVTCINLPAVPQSMSHTFAYRHNSPGLSQNPPTPTVQEAKQSQSYQSVESPKVSPTRSLTALPHFEPPLTRPPTGDDGRRRTISLGLKANFTRRRSKSTPRDSFDLRTKYLSIDLRNLQYGINPITSSNKENFNSDVHPPLYNEPKSTVTALGISTYDSMTSQFQRRVAARTASQSQVQPPYQVGKDLRRSKSSAAVGVPMDPQSPIRPKSGVASTTKCNAAFMGSQTTSPVDFHGAFPNRRPLGMSDATLASKPLSSGGSYGGGARARNAWTLSMPPMPRAQQDTNNGFELHNGSSKSSSTSDRKPTQPSSPNPADSEVPVADVIRSAMARQKSEAGKRRSTARKTEVKEARTVAIQRMQVPMPSPKSARAQRPITSESIVIGLVPEDMDDAQSRHVRQRSTPTGWGEHIALWRARRKSIGESLGQGGRAIDPAEDEEHKRPAQMKRRSTICADAATMHAETYAALIGMHTEHHGNSRPKNIIRNDSAVVNVPSRSGSLQASCTKNTLAVPAMPLPTSHTQQGAGMLTPSTKSYLATGPQAPRERSPGGRVRTPHGNFHPYVPPRNGSSEAAQNVAQPINEPHSAAAPASAAPSATERTDAACPEPSAIQNAPCASSSDGQVAGVRDGEGAHATDEWPACLEEDDDDSEYAMSATLFPSPPRRNPAISINAALTVAEQPVQAREVKV